MIRKILSVIAGYLVFAISSALLFILSGQPPHQDAPLRFKLITLIYGLFFAVLAGLVVQLIARQQNLALNFVLVVVIFMLAMISLLTSGGNHWTQFMAMFIFAPVSFAGGYFRIKRIR